MYRWSESLIGIVCRVGNRNLGKSGLKVPTIALAVWSTFGTKLNDQVRHFFSPFLTHSLSIQSWYFLHLFLIHSHSVLDTFLMHSHSVLDTFLIYSPSILNTFLLILPKLPFFRLTTFDPFEPFTLLTCTCIKVLSYLNHTTRESERGGNGEEREGREREREREREWVSE